MKDMTGWAELGVLDTIVNDAATALERNDLPKARALVKTYYAGSHKIVNRAYKTYLDRRIAATEESLKKL